MPTSRRWRFLVRRQQSAALQAGSLPLPLIEQGELPTTLDGLRARMQAWIPELSVTDLTRQLLRAVFGPSQAMLDARARADAERCTQGA